MPPTLSGIPRERRNAIYEQLANTHAIIHEKHSLILRLSQVAHVSTRTAHVLSCSVLLYGVGKHSKLVGITSKPLEHR